MVFIVNRILKSVLIIFYLIENYLKKCLLLQVGVLLAILGFSLKDQGSNIILNLFGGTTVNAARGIAMQVNGIISNFFL